MVTVVADTESALPAPGVPLASMQSPTDSAEASAARVCVKAVVVVQLTVT